MATIHDNGPNLCPNLFEVDDLKLLIYQFEVETISDSLVFFKYTLKIFYM